MLRRLARGWFGQQTSVSLLGKFLLAVNFPKMVGSAEALEFWMVFRMNIVTCVQHGLISRWLMSVSTVFV